MSHLAERGSPIESLVSACGDGAISARGVEAISREPYLQQVSAQSAIVGWVSAAPDATPQVTVTLPDGTAVATVAAEPEDTRVRRQGDKQVWARIGQLQPDTVYCYSIADRNGVLAEPAGFRTAPTADTDHVRFLALGDSGTGGSDQKALLQQMFTVPYDLIIHAGDLAYDSGTLSQFENTVFAVYEDLFRHVSFFPVAGNHEYETADAGPFRDVFALPNNEKWYSFDWGHVHFVALDTEQSYATQRAWLEQDLARTTQPWKIVYLHKPLYSSGEHGSDMEAREAFAPVFEKYVVQLVIGGHDHHYERMKPQNGVAYLVSGGGGRGTRTASGADFTAFTEEVIHFVYVDVGPDELVMYAIDGTGKQFDSMVVPRVP
jgi:3',5'-cyclic AMP phosphodiesterase CpdA